MTPNPNISLLFPTGMKTKLKPLIPLLAAAAMLAASCTDDETRNRLDALSSENEQLKTELSNKDSALTVFEESFTAIQRNLALISEREVAIQLKSGELQMSDDARDEITKDIQAINNLLEENKKTISHLSKKVSDYGTEVSGFEKLVDQLQSDIRSKEEHISFMKENLTAANFTIEILNEMLDSAEFRNEVQSSLLKITTDELYTGYYALGSYKELERNDVLTKAGSIAGIAGSKQLKEDFNKDYFEAINTMETRSIPLRAKKVEIVTNHPSNSYTIDGDDSKTLRITDIERFWSSTKYLVVITD